jgi:hypothetical protein
MPYDVADINRYPNLNAVPARVQKTQLFVRFHKETGFIYTAPVLYELANSKSQSNQGAEKKKIRTFK